MSVEQQGDTVTTQVLVREPGMQGETILMPSYNLSEAAAVEMPTFPGITYRLKIEDVDMNARSVRLNIEAPVTETSDARTRLTLLASTLGFTALFVWMFRIRSTLLGVQWQLDQRKGAVV
ncbi:MAG: hypothetical protein HC828_18875 [Blastochloris sp.]|nr:hypothetical protein [Blastochloris sp.]